MTADRTAPTGASVFDGLPDARWCPERRMACDSAEECAGRESGCKMRVRLNLQAPADRATPLPDCGHGHVHPRADGILARCGGPGMCPMCAIDLARKNESAAPPGAPQGEPVK